MAETFKLEAQLGSAVQQIQQLTAEFSKLISVLDKSAKNYATLGKQITAVENLQRTKATSPQEFAKMMEKAHTMDIGKLTKMYQEAGGVLGKEFYDRFNKSAARAEVKQPGMHELEKLYQGRGQFIREQEQLAVERAAKAREKADISQRRSAALVEKQERIIALLKRQQVLTMQEGLFVHKATHMELAAEEALILKNLQLNKLTNKLSQEELLILKKRFEQLQVAIPNAMKEIQGFGFGASVTSQILMQLSFGIEDFMLTIGPLGLGGALRSAANNISMIMMILPNIHPVLRVLGMLIPAISAAIVNLIPGMREWGKASKDTTDEIEKQNSRIKEQLDLIEKLREEKRKAALGEKLAQDLKEQEEIEKKIAEAKKDQIKAEREAHELREKMLDMVTAIENAEGRTGEAKSPFKAGSQLFSAMIQGALHPIQAGRLIKALFLGQETALGKPIGAEMAEARLKAVDAQRRRQELEQELNDKKTRQEVETKFEPARKAFEEQAEGNLKKGVTPVNLLDMLTDRAARQGIAPGAVRGAIADIIKKELTEQAGKEVERTKPLSSLIEDYKKEIDSLRERKEALEKEPGRKFEVKQRVRDLEGHIDTLEAEIKRLEKLKKEGKPDEPDRHETNIIMGKLTTAIENLNKALQENQGNNVLNRR